MWLVAAWTVLVAAAAALSAHLGQPIETCLLKRLTGLPCPTCGLTRGAVRFLHGDVAGAWLLNPLGFTLAAAVVAALLLRAAWGRRLDIRFSRREKLLLWIALGALVAGNWLYVIVAVG